MTVATWGPWAHASCPRRSPPDIVTAPMRVPSLILGTLIAATIAAPAAAVENESAERDREPPPERIEIHELERRAAMHIESTPVGTVVVQPTSSPGALDWLPLGPRPIAYEYWRSEEHTSE